jgi:hypothetical protein
MSEANVQEALQKGIRAARRGADEPARRLLGYVVQQDPGNEEGWLWLARVVETPAQRADCLQRVLDINPQNEWAAGQLAELESAPPEPAVPAQPPPTEPTPEFELDLLQCPHCNGSLKLQSGARAKTLVCQHCNSVLDLTSEQANVVGQLSRRYKPSMPIELGMEGTFDDQRYQVIGWLRYEGWDDEDRWRWDEWLLASSIGQLRWLSYDSEDGFLLQKEIAPTQAFNPSTASSIPVPGGSARITERSPARIISLAGELTWQAKAGERMRYIEAKLGNLRYSVEYSRDEIELLEGSAISDLTVWRAFGRQDLVEKTIEDSKRKRQYLSMAGICAVFILLSCMGGVFTTLTGRKLVTQEIQVSAAERAVGPFEVTAPGRVHKVSLRARGLPVNSWAVVDVSVLDEEDQEYYLAGSEFWDEEGRDSDGYWHESDLAASHLFIPDTAGQYTLYLVMDEATVQTVDVEVTVKSGVWLGRYFVILGVLCAALCFLFIVMGSGRKADLSEIKGA